MVNGIVDDTNQAMRSMIQEARGYYQEFYPKYKVSIMEDDDGAQQLKLEEPKAKMIEMDDKKEEDDEISQQAQQLIALYNGWKPSGSASNDQIVCNNDGPKGGLINICNVFLKTGYTIIGAVVILGL